MLQQCTDKPQTAHLLLADTYHFLPVKLNIERTGPDTMAIIAMQTQGIFSRCTGVSVL
jgi:hypothetical protein